MTSFAGIHFHFVLAGQPTSFGWLLGLRLLAMLRPVAGRLSKGIPETTWHFFLWFCFYRVALGKIFPSGG